MNQFFTLVPLSLFSRREVKANANQYLSENPNPGTNRENFNYFLSEIEKRKGEIEPSFEMSI